eukprot:m.51903 g.51903  ORF g.51903 m.51903 type:complete len:253 (-) comp21516_c1_seq1:4-762(-)
MNMSKTFYYPSPPRPVSMAEKANATVQSPSWRRNQESDEEDTSFEVSPLSSETDEEHDLHGFSRRLANPYSQQTAKGVDGAEKRTINTANTASMSAINNRNTAVHRQMQEQDDCSDQHHHNRQENDAGIGPVKISDGENINWPKPRVTVSRKTRAPLQAVELPRHGVAPGSTLGKYIQRFRHAPPLSRETRDRLNAAKLQQSSSEFWWLRPSTSRDNVNTNSTTLSPHNNTNINTTSLPTRFGAYLRWGGGV